MDKELIFAAVSMVKEMAGQKPMTAEEVVASIGTIAGGLDCIAMGGVQPVAEEPASYGDPKAAIKESSITCLICGKKFKVITRKHLATHGLTAEEYRVKYGYKKNQALACKSLARERRAKMKDVRLWERRKKAGMEGQE